MSTTCGRSSTKAIKRTSKTSKRQLATVQKPTATITIRRVAQLDPQVKSSVQKMLDVYWRNASSNDELHPKNHPIHTIFALLQFATETNRLNEPAFEFPNFQAIRSSKNTPPNESRMRKRNVITCSCSCHINFGAD